MMYSQEMPYPPDDQAKNMTIDDVRYYGTSQAYINRWEKVHDVRAGLYPDLLEAEAVWGNCLNELFEPIRELDRDLAIHTRLYLDWANPKHNAEYKKELTEAHPNNREILFDRFEGGDEFNTKYQAALKPLEIFLQKKLGRA